MTNDTVNTGKLTGKIPNTYQKAFPEGTVRRKERQEYMKIYMRKIRKKAKEQKASK